LCGDGSGGAAQIGEDGEHAPVGTGVGIEAEFEEDLHVRRVPVNICGARPGGIGYTLFYSGVRVSELVALDVDDVPLSARKGKVIVREGKGGDSREIPLLEPAARAALSEWKIERASWPGAATTALFVNRWGGRLSARAVDQLLDELAAAADLTGEDGQPAASAHTIRHTFVICTASAP